MVYLHSIESHSKHSLSKFLFFIFYYRTLSQPLHNRCKQKLYKMLFANFIVIICPRVKLKAVNSIGPGPSSAALKANTLPLPPSPPPLSCPAAGHNYLKLKWGDGKNPQFTQYTVQMENPRLAE